MAMKSAEAKAAGIAMSIAGWNIRTPSGDKFSQ
ncbi:hypothetical protein FHT86_007057 [Rhizobium sp. BK313]|nr:hypothetical protein [Rhizobium sp. BK313]